MRGVSVLVVRVYVHMLQEQNDSNSLRLCSSYLLFRVAIFSLPYIFSRKWECLQMKMVQYVFLMIAETVCRLNPMIFFLPVYLFSMLKPLFLPLGALYHHMSRLICTYTRFSSQEVKSGLCFSLKKLYHPLQRLKHYNKVRH